MGAETILSRFDSLNVWKRGGQRAPHKLYALGRWTGGDADTPFRDSDADLTSLLKEFGPSRQSYHPEYPFWRLQNDGVHEDILSAVGLTLETGPAAPRKRDPRFRNRVPTVRPALLILNGACFLPLRRG